MDTGFHFSFPFLGCGGNREHQFEIVIKEDTPFKAEVISKHFEHLLEQQISPVKKGNTLQFTISKPEYMFLRIQSRSPLHIDSLKMSKER